MHYSTPKVLGLNTQSTVDKFVPVLKKRLEWFKTDQLLFPYGGDFLNFGLQFGRRARGICCVVKDDVIVPDLATDGTPNIGGV